MSRRHTVNSGADLRLLAWTAAETDNGQDRMVQRKDRYGHPIRWEDYEDEESQSGGSPRRSTRRSVVSLRTSARSASAAGNRRVAGRRTRLASGGYPTDLPRCAGRRAGHSRRVRRATARQSVTSSTKVAVSGLLDMYALDEIERIHI